MNERPGDAVETCFESPGSLPRPGWIGRAVRMAIGLWLLQSLYMLLRYGWGELVGVVPPQDWTWWAPPLGTLVWVWLVYFSAHLGGSFALSALLATPGCEMRAMPHLWTRLTGRATKEHYCPGIIDNIDRWERSRTG